ncbi:hypothetical protein LAh9_53 [Aeromonas phage LAh_9]|uniref:Uncharacterized protein n=1 Tax=Aeromonas phage LAh_9 TaxID=2591033 RepID=A0A514A0T2_9CAUD|nr:hypothetical protein HWC32_gp053 [Aeromonas phage LAh_9]QDH46887.1 hypothetical protein LAh9_53 [Aeromonas phage LAh_9]
MSVKIKFIFDGLDPEGYGAIRDICYGSMMTGARYSFPSTSIVGNIFGSISSSNGNWNNSFVKSVRSYSPDVDGRYNPIELEDEIWERMKLVAESNKEAFWPVTFGEEEKDGKFFEVSLDCPADQFWFCINTIRCVHDTYICNTDFFPQVSEIVGVWKALLIFGGYRFNKVWNESKIRVSPVERPSWTCIWSPCFANKDFVTTLLKSPESLCNKLEPLRADDKDLVTVSRMALGYEEGEWNDEDPLWEGPMTALFQEGFNKKRHSLTFSETLQALEVTDEEIEKLRKFIFI